MSIYPKVKDPTLVGNYPALAKSGGGYVWDDVLEYRVWCHPHFYPFESYEDALYFSQHNIGTEEPLALILQEEYIDEPESGNYLHVKEPRITEWSVEFLNRPKRKSNTIPDFLAPNAPSNRLDIIRGLI